MSVLRKKVAQIPLVGGRNERLDPRALGVVPWLAAAADVYRTRTGEWAPRHGFTALATTKLDGSTNSFTTIRKLAARDNELVAMATRNFWSYSPTRLGWKDLALDLTTFTDYVDQRIVTHTITTVPHEEAARANYGEQTVVEDSAYGGGFVLTVWQDSTVGDVLYAINEESTNQPIRTETILGSTSGTGGSRPKVIFSGNCFLAFWVDASGASSTLKVTKIPTSTLTAAAAVNVATDLLGTATGTPWYEVMVNANNGNVWVAYRGTGPNVRALEWDPTSNSASIAVTTVVASDAASHAIGWSHVGTLTSGAPHLLTAANSATGIVSRTLNASTLAQTASTTILANPGDVASITGRFTTGDNGDVAIWELRHASDNRQHAIKWGFTNPVSDGSLYEGCVLASKIFQVGTDYYFLASLSFAKQPGYYLVNVGRPRTLSVSGSSASAGIVGRFLRGNGRAVPATRNALANPSSITTTKWVAAMQKVTEVYSLDASGGFSIRTRPVYATVDLAGVPPPPVSFGKSVMFPGSLSRIYCGLGVDEIGFAAEPDKPTLALVAGTELTDGVYQVCVVMAYVEGGMTWRSAPSEVASITVTGNDRIQVTAYMPQVVLGRNRTLKGAVFMEVYRTKSAGSQFFRSISTPVTFTTGPTAVVTDSMTDTQLELQLPLYTQSGELLNSPPPASRAMWMHGQRCMAIDAENPSDVWASKELQPGFGFGWHPDMRVRMEEGGPAFAGCLMDGQSIVFKRNQIWRITGDWPDARGSGSLPLTQRVAEGFGCIQPETVCVTKDGVWFKDPKKGMCFLDRGLSVTQLGKPLQNFDTLTHVGTNIVEDFEQVRFVNTTQSLMIYDYLEKQWMSWNVNQVPDLATCTAVVNGVYYIGRADGVAIFYDTTTRKDLAVGNYTPNISIRLPLAGIEGIQRIYRVTLLGGLQNAGHLLTMRLFNDHASFNPAAGAAAAERKVIVAPSQNDEPTGAFAVTMRPKYQRSTVVLVNFFFQPGVLNNEGLRFSALAVEVGLRSPAVRRLPPANRA